MIDLRQDYLIIVEDILKQYLQDYTVWAFGSRVTGTAKKYSDLDLTVITDVPLDFGLLRLIRDAFSESDLPFKVDVVDWATTSLEFQAIIKQNYKEYESKMVDLNQPATTVTRAAPEKTDRSTNEVLVIMHIDDIGMLPDTADIAIEVMKHGLAKSGSIMVPAPGFERAAEVIKANPDLDCGIHITLTNEWQEIVPWRPLLPKDKVPSLYNELGLMWQNETEF